MKEIELRLGGRVLHAYDTGGDATLTVFWHHGTPNIGQPPEPLFRKSIRWVSFDRPGYGGSTRLPGRSVGSVAADVAAIADELGVERFAVMGHSGGGCHALACGALLPDRVVAVVSGAALAPFGAEGLDWFAGMVPSGRASLSAAAAGRQAKEAQRLQVSSTTPSSPRLTWPRWMDRGSGWAGSRVPAWTPGRAG